MNSSSIVLHGDVIDNLRDDQWSAILKAEELVFARTLPRHKLKIVRQLQNQGEIVGVQNAIYLSCEPLCRPLVMVSMMDRLLRGQIWAFP